MMDVPVIAEILERSLHWRYATKKFDPDLPLGDELLNVLLEAVRMAPTSYGLQPFHVMVIRDRWLREKIHEEASAQSQILDCQALVVLSIDEKLDEGHVDNYMKRIASQRQTDRQKLEGFSNTIRSTLSSKPIEKRQEWAARQAYLALGFLLQAAAIHEVDTCPMEGFKQDKLRTVLPDHQDKLPVVLTALGYRSENDPYASLTKVRKTTEELITII